MSSFISSASPERGSDRIDTLPVSKRSDDVCFMWSRSAFELVPGASLKRQQKTTEVRGSPSLESRSSRTATSSTPLVSITVTSNSPNDFPKSGTIRPMFLGNGTSRIRPLLTARNVSRSHSDGCFPTPDGYQISVFVRPASHAVEHPRPQLILTLTVPNKVMNGVEVVRLAVLRRLPSHQTRHVSDCSIDFSAHPRRLRAFVPVLPERGPLYRAEVRHKVYQVGVFHRNHGDPELRAASNVTSQIVVPPPPVSRTGLLMLRSSALAGTKRSNMKLIAVDFPTPMSPMNAMLC